jgi:hypothetical protein
VASQEGYLVPNLVKTSLQSCIVSGLWLVCAREASVEVVTTKPEMIRTARIRILAWFPMVFVVG